MGVNGENSEPHPRYTSSSHLGMNVTAAGVETATQPTQLRELKCEYARIFFSKPDYQAGALIAAQPQ